MSRKDSKGRNLHYGEGQRSDGRYSFRYKDAKGKNRTVYSWTLTIHDQTPEGKRPGMCLRQMEKQIQKDLFDRVTGTNMTVLELAEKYIETKTAVRTTTLAGYKTLLKFLSQDDFGARRITDVTTLEAKHWIIHLQRDCSKGYSTIHSFRGVLRPAFQLAEDDDLIRRNPFSFELATIVINDSIPRIGLTKNQERRFLEFVESDKHYSRYFEEFYILFNTGLRISEFCGLTDADLDFKEKSIRIDRQLMRSSKMQYYLEPPKTECGTRYLPMNKQVESCIHLMLDKRKAGYENFKIDGVSGFLSFDKNGRPRVALHWENYLKYAVEKYNRLYKEALPKITPHVCRHTYCSKMARNGMSPVRLKYLMGHSDISVTYNIYTHIGFEDVKNEVLKS